ncbi:MAG: hypothetical protein ASARMPREDX12_008602 [Alectoria sarmentosa]|nr:MAG: hypothetical protein ASARMPREDX12_008602 [Alectoria sarmentosa]
MFCIPNQSSLPRAYTQFTDEGDETSRLLPSGNRDRLVDCMEEFVKYSILMRPQFELFGDRFSERAERELKAAKAAAEKVDGVKRGEVDKIVGASNDQGIQKDGKGRAGTAADIVNGIDSTIYTPDSLPGENPIDAYRKP